MRAKSIIVGVLVLFCLSAITVQVSAREIEIGDLRGRAAECAAGLEDVQGRFAEIQAQLKPEVELQIEIEIEDMKNEVQILDDAMAQRGDQATIKEKRLLNRLMNKLEIRERRLEIKIQKLEDRLGIHP